MSNPPKMPAKKPAPRTGEELPDEALEKVAGGGHNLANAPEQEAVRENGVAKGS